MVDLYKIYLTLEEIDELNKGLKNLHRQRKETIKNLLKTRDNNIIRRPRTRKPNKLLIIDDENKLKMSIIENNITK